MWRRRRAGAASSSWITTRWENFSARAELVVSDAPGAIPGMALDESFGILGSMATGAICTSEVGCLQAIYRVSKEVTRRDEHWHGWL